MAARGGTLDGSWKMYAALEDEIAALLSALEGTGGEPEKRRRAHRVTGRRRQ